MSSYHKATPAPNSLQAPLRDGMAWACMMGFGESYISACGIFLKATVSQVAMLATIPAFIGALFQLLSVWALRFFSSRKTPLVWTVRLVSVIWLLIALTLFLFPWHSAAIWILIVLVALYRAGENFVVPPWNSLIGDLVPPETRGTFFGRRNKRIGALTFVTLIIGGAILDISADWQQTAVGFGLIFLFASVSRMISGYWIARYEDRQMYPVREGFFTFWDFLRRSPRSNFARFVYFVSWINGAVALSGPFFALYMLRDLDLSYAEFTLVTAASTVTQFLTISAWGRVSDQVGNKRILNVCGFGVGVVPFLWIFDWNIWYLILIQTFGGFMWAGFNLASANFVFDAVSPAKRARCAAYQALVNATFVLVGSLLGAWIVERLPESISLAGLTWVPHSPLIGIFVISGIVRLCTAAVILPLFKEVRDVPAVRHGELLFRITGLRPLGGATFSLVTEAADEEIESKPEKRD